MVKVAQDLKQIVDTWEHVEERVAEITELEHLGDTITHRIMAQLNRTFVTPFDREDIALLAHSLDDVVDFIHASADAMFLYKVDRPGERAKQLAEIIVQAASELERAMPHLRHRAELKQLVERWLSFLIISQTSPRLLNGVRFTSTWRVQLIGVRMWLMSLKG